MNIFLSNEKKEYIVLLINTISKKKFVQFIEYINQKKKLVVFSKLLIEIMNIIVQVTFKGNNTYKLSYIKFLKFMKLAILRL